MFKLGSRSRQRLSGVHEDLVRVVERALEISKVDFTVLEGVRSLEKQKRNFASGASLTMNSRHLTGHAVDLGAWVDDDVSWHGAYYHQIADAMFQAASELGVEIEWGGHWKSIFDGPHFELSWSTYPK